MTFVNRELADKYQDFFNFMSQEYNLTLTKEEMDEMKALVLSHATVQSGKCTGCEESKGETKMWCCNHCGRRIEDF